MKRDRDEEDESQNPGGSQTFDHRGSQLSQEELGLLLETVREKVKKYHPKLQGMTRAISGMPGVTLNQATVIDALQSAPGLDFGVPSTPPTPSLSSQGSGLSSLFGSQQQSTQPSQEYYVAQTPPAHDFDFVMEDTFREKPERRAQEHEDKFVEGKMEETSTEVREVREVREVEEEVQLDEETGVYISTKAEEIYNQALNELIGGIIAEAMPELPHIVDYPPTLLRWDMLDDPTIKSQLDNDKDATLDALRVEIWRLLQEDAMEQQ